MSDIIVIIIIAAILLPALRSFIGHFKGRSGCCSGGDYKARPRKLSHVAEKKTAIVEGMSCRHCVNRVTEAVQDIPGTSALVKLRGGKVIISCSEPMDSAIFVKAIEDAGYIVRQIN